MKRSIFIVILICVFQQSGLSQVIFVNPGIKAGYTFGQGGGFTFGFEISVVALKINSKSKDGGYGIVYDYDTFGEYSKHHFGIEYLNYLTYLDVGPTIVNHGDNSTTGFTINTSAGLIFIPYYSYTYVDSSLSFHELGSYGKWFIADMSWFKM